MATRMRRAIFRHLDELRWEPTEKRVRVYLGGEVVADTTDAWLVWEPRRVVPTYAVPVTSLSADLVPTARSDEMALDDVGLSLPAVSDRPVLDPSIPFAVHTTDGDAVDVRGARAEVGTGAGFRPADPDLAEHVVLDFDAFDWLEEDEPVVSHPHDPFHRIDVLASRRHVVIGLDGVTLAESTSPLLLFETSLPTRYYLPSQDVRSHSNRAAPARTAPTRVRRGTGHRWWGTRRCPTWRGPTSSPCTTPAGSRGASASSTRRST